MLIVTVDSGSTIMIAYVMFRYDIVSGSSST